MEKRSQINDVMSLAEGVRVNAPLNRCMGWGTLFLGIAKRWAGGKNRRPIRALVFPPPDFSSALFVRRMDFLFS